MNRNRAAVVAGVTSLVLAGCDTSSVSIDAGGNGEVGKPAAQVLADAVAALRAASSVHLEVYQPGGLALAADIVNGQGARGWVDIGAAQGDFVFTNGTVYVKESSLVGAVLGARAAAAVGDRWVIVPRTVRSGVEVFSDVARLAHCLSVDHGTLSSGGADWPGQAEKVVINEKSDVPGTAQGRLWVAATGTPYPTDLVFAGRTSAGTPPGGAECHIASAGDSDDANGTSLTFSGYNRSYARISVPSGAVSLESLLGPSVSG